MVRFGSHPTIMQRKSLSVMFKHFLKQKSTFSILIQTIMHASFDYITIPNEITLNLLKRQDLKLKYCFSLMVQREGIFT